MPMQIQVGRIDMSGLVCYSNKAVNPRSELDLLRSYLARNHAWRTGQWSVTPRGAIRDGFDDRDFSRNGWGNMPQLCRDGIEVIEDGLTFPALTDKDYLICHLCGGGQLTSMAGTGGSDDFALNDIRVPFVMLLGSAMLGRWNSESNFVRSCLASGTDEKGCLAAFGAGAPHVFIHRMGLGGTVGESFLLSENNFSVYPANGSPEPGLYTPAESAGIPPCAGRVYQSLHGDPTLSLYPVKPVTNFSGQVLTDRLLLSWVPSDGTEFCNVYRSANPNGPFTKLNNEPVTGRVFVVTDHFAGLRYMVRAVRLVETPSGSFHQASCGVMWSDSQTPPMPPDPGTPVSKATFIKADPDTQGSWNGTFGADGYVLCAGKASFPDYATVLSSDKQPYVWSDTSDELRALFVPETVARLAAVWKAEIGFTVDINSDAMPHRLALYLLDWDRTGRQQRVDILDGATDLVLDTRFIDRFGEGKWLVYDFHGAIKIRITNHLMGVTNCVLSGIFFSPTGATPAPAPTPKTRTLEIQSSTNATGPWTVRGTVEVEKTADAEFYRLGIL